MTDEEIPLDITGHEDREAPDASEPSSGDEPRDREAPGASEPSNGDESQGGVGPAAGGSDLLEDGDRSDVDETETDGTDADDGEEVEPVEVLVQLAEDGEIDPWDIDIVEVTDKFLARLDGADLQTSGRALFYASVLLRMKGDAMLEADEEEPREPEPWEQPLDEITPEGPDPFAALEQEMDRRLERKRARGMPQTLDELVRDLREAERDTWWKESREYDTSDSPGGFRRGTQELDYRAADDLRMDEEPTEEDVTGTAHAEDIDEIVENVYGALREHYEAGREEVLYREIAGAGGSRVETFLGLLFLAHRGRVRLQQDDIFGDLWIQDPASATGSGEAVAD